MATWPTIAAPVFPLSEAPEDNVLRSSFDAGYEQTRQRFTRNRRTFGLRWTALKAADKALLDAFYLTNSAGSFTWTYPGTSTTYTVRFTGPPKMQLTATGLYSVEVELREV